MDYTKDAILIEGIKSLEEETAGTLHTSDENAYVDGGGSGKLRHHHPYFSTMALMNSTKFIEKKVIMSESDLTSDLLMKANRSLSALAPVSASSSPPSILEGQQYDEMINDTMEYIPMSMRPETYIVPVLFAIIFIIGVIGNGTLIVIFIKHRSMRNVPNMFIVSLAIGDLLVILFCVPFTSTVYTVDSWPYGLVVCKFSEFIKDLSVGVSVFTLTALSADRYFAIVDPMRKLTGRRATRITIISIIGIWILSVLVALPSALYSYIRVFPEVEEGEEEEDEMDDGRTFQVCYPYPTEFGPAYAQVMVMFHFLVYYAVPLFFIATFYIIMARHLVLSTRNMPGEAQGQAKQIQARKKVAKMILSFVVIFAICFFPQHLFLLWFYFYPDSENSFNAFWNICRIVGFCLSFMNSCINPITLYCVSGTFRKQFNDHLFCCFCDESGNRPPRGGRLSGGGTLAGGGGGHGGGLCAGCVSLSGNHGQLYGNDSRYGNGSLGRDCNGRIHRGSTWENSDRMMSKRKSTWETQTTVVNHRVLNMTNPGGIAASANIHVNLCSEPEHIPLMNMNKTANHHHRYHPKAAVAAVGATSAQGTTTIISTVQENLNDNDYHCHVIPSGSSTTTSRSSHHFAQRISSKGYGGSGSGDARNKLHSDINSTTTKTDPITSDNCNVSLSAAGGDTEKNEQQEHNHNQQEQHQRSQRKDRPSLIEEETSFSEQEKSSNNSVGSNSNKSSSRQLSPNKTYSKVGEIFSKISTKYSNSCSSSPAKLSVSQNAENSSPSKKSPTKIAPVVGSGSAKLQTTTKVNLEHSDAEDDVVVFNYNNNNNYTHANPHHHDAKAGIVVDDASMDECTVTSLIVVPVNDPLGSNLENLDNVIQCYN